MRIVQIVPGAGGSFYCENCLRDAGLVGALRAAGHEVLLVPLYLPLAADGAEAPADGAAPADAPMFFGGVNVYLQQKSSLFRKTPRWLDKLLDSPRLLKWAASKAGMTSARDLAETTLSMLQGPDGRQTKELQRLADFLAGRPPVDVVCLSNALLLGLAGEIKKRLGSSVAVMLQDEDMFLDDLPEPYSARCWQAVAERCADADVFLAVSKYYAERMRVRLGLDARRLRVVYTGIDAGGYVPAAHPQRPPTIGYLSRACREFGLDVLVDAFILLKADARFGDARLRVAGGSTAADGPFLGEVRGRAASANVLHDIDFLPDFDRPARQEFLRGLSVLSAPVRHAEAFGMYVLEALACGVPAVLPRRGAFPELAEATGGCLLCEGDDPPALAAAISDLLAAPAACRELGRRGRQAVLERFTLERMAAEVTDIYRQVAGEQRN